MCLRSREFALGKDPGLAFGEKAGYVLGKMTPNSFGGESVQNGRVGQFKRLLWIYEDDEAALRSQDA